ncbi:hypothetical protein DL770_002224 [Monosporascus sp. CRB-9-2]|nr:hypothetical protein DL770_002224 [Monosporascus sp. CRB-9-2]
MNPPRHAGAVPGCSRYKGTNGGIQKQKPGSQNSKRDYPGATLTGNQQRNPYRQPTAQPLQATNSEPPPHGGTVPGCSRYKAITVGQSHYQCAPTSSKRKDPKAGAGNRNNKRGYPGATLTGDQPWTPCPTAERCRNAAATEVVLHDITAGQSRYQYTLPSSNRGDPETEAGSRNKGEMKAGGSRNANPLSHEKGSPTISSRLIRNASQLMYQGQDQRPRPSS